MTLFDTISRYNFWQTPPPLGFFRRDYLDSIKQFMPNNLIKVLVGQRRVGKSYILRQIIKELIDHGTPATHTLFINKEFTVFDFIETHTDLSDFISSYRSHFGITEKCYVFIDEVQQIQDWQKTINSLSQDFTQDIELFITGSNSDLLSGELSTLLSGRYVSFLINPFSYTEYCSYRGTERDLLTYANYMSSGGLPELLRLDHDETKQHYLASLRDTILLRDIVQRYQVKDAVLLHDVFTYIVNNTSSLLSVTNLIKYFKGKNRKTNYETLSNYLEMLCKAFLVHKCERYKLKGKEVLSGNAKYYLTDQSFKNYLYPNHEMGLGHQLENLVYIELLSCGYKIHVGQLRDKEVDFVAQKNGKTIYLQVSYSIAEESTRNREYASLLAIRDHYPKYVVTLDPVLLDTNKGVIHIQAWNLRGVLV